MASLTQWTKEGKKATANAAESADGDYNESFEKVKEALGEDE